MRYERNDPAATVVDGKIYIFGGIGRVLNAIGTTERYDKDDSETILFVHEKE